MPISPAIAAIVNVTPDSFSGDGQLDTSALRAQIEEAAADGAQIIDLGAESTRPGAISLTAEDEWARLAPVLAALSALPGITYSLDTRHASTARRALETASISWINDVSGLSDAGMVDVLSGSQCRYVLMHSLAIPADPRLMLAEEADPVAEIMAFARGKLAVLAAGGIDPARVIIDPGIGFGKTPAQSRALLTRLEEFKPLGLPLLVGHSRKSFLARVNDVAANDRDLETAVISAHLAGQGVDYLRVHNVAMTRRALATAHWLQAA